MKRGRKSPLLLPVLALLWVTSINAVSQTLIARNLVYHVDTGAEQVLYLKGFNYDGAKLSYTITSLPLNGEIYQLSQIYSEYGYEPKRAASPIATVPTTVTGSNNRIVFLRTPFGGPRRDNKYAEFRYTVTDGVAVSNEGIVVITTSDALVSSTFDLDIDNWRILWNGAGADSRPHFQPISRGVQLSYYIYGLDAVVHRREDTGDDSMLWYFTAPPKFLGNHWAAYGGSLDFVLSSAEGSFDATNLNLAGMGHLVELECATCAQFTGLTLAMPLSPVFSYDGTITQFKLPLSELAGWVKDPKNVILSWSPPTQCEFVSVLSGLSALRILGDFTRGYESVALDSVVLRHGPGQPVKCYTSTV
ncbi:hypothetical protein L917_21189 [Phytophthora nicotianae]|uniref:Laminin IV type A domain-containing protein n=1 Tax=Phytophthora nicotianae TaxID=4792 RepID=W2JYF1_PHYNI|nr:hypothetical protein L915_21469 [Phytophthora nicotianae]ETL77922.1 hypothetical protein L917_21189 [Phytophthora nicotianae]